MKHKKFALCVIAGILCMGLFSGCTKLPWDFRSTEEAQKYVLSTLKNKYHESFVFIEEPTYKEEKIGIHWIKGKIAPENDLTKTAFVYARNTAMFQDNYHAYYFADQIRALTEPLFENKDYIKEYHIEVKGKTSDTHWTGNEPLDEYLEQKEYEIIADVYLYEDKTDDEYADEICLLIEEVSQPNLHIQLDIWDKEDEWIFRANTGEPKTANDKEYIIERIRAHRSLWESNKDYQEWKKENQQNEGENNGN